MDETISAGFSVDSLPLQKFERSIRGELRRLA